MSLTAEELVDNIENTIPDNVAGNISPADVRENLINIVNSVNCLVTNPQHFEVFDTRNTKIGESALSSPHLQSSGIQDNTGVGFFSLYATFVGSQNTALGSHSLACNVYGSGNTGIGYNSLIGNLHGNNNVALGQNSLYKTKSGDNNIAIGNAAGYFISPTDSFKFILGSHDISESGICENLNGRPGDVSLLYGDLLNPKLGVNTNQINNEGVFQVNGSITPVDNSFSDSLGTENFGWGNAYIDTLVPQGDLRIAGDIVPTVNKSIDIGSPSLMWRNLYVENLITETTSTVENVITVNTFSQFPDKVFYIASSGINQNTGGPGAFLNDEGLNGAGITVQSSGFDFTRSYSWLFRSPDTSLNFLEEDNVFSRARWESNISIGVESGRHVRTNRVLGRERLDLLPAISGVASIHLGPAFLVSDEQSNETFYNNWDNDLSGITNISNIAVNDNNLQFNLIADSGEIQQGWYTRHSGIDNPLTGFRTTYFDNNDSLDRLVTESLLNGESKGCFVITRDNGYVGISDSGSFVPDCLLDVTSLDSSRVRINSNNESSINLVNNSGGLEICYSGDLGYFKTLDNGVESEAFMVSGDKLITDAVTFKETNSSNLTPLSGNINLFAERINAFGRSHSVFMQDEQGNVFDLLDSGVFNDISQPEFVYHDNSFNTLAGRDSTENRLLITGSGNTGFGHSALKNLISGSGNIGIGNNAGLGSVSGNKNIFIGNNIVTDDVSNKFILGSSNDNENPLLFADLPTSGNPGKLNINNFIEIHDPSGNNSLQLDQTSSDTVINKQIRSMNGYPDNNLIFRFSGDIGSQDILIFNPDGALLDTGNYFQEPIERSSVELRADLNLLGAIHFNDGTRLDSFTQPSGGPGISIDSDVISFDISTLDIVATSDLSETSTFLVTNNGQTGSIDVQNLRTLLLTENPQLYFESYLDGQFNLVITEDSNVDHLANSTNVFIGRSVARDATGFTNSVMIGLQAGQGSQVSSNPDGNLDISTVFIGQNAGQDSFNADNSVFVGTSCGLRSNGCDNSVFIGNSAGLDSRSEKSVGIGDNSLATVIGRNNIEIAGEKVTNRTYLSGAQNNKINVGGIIAGDVNTGHVRVGGGENLNPSAVLEVRPDSTDNNRLMELFDKDGVLRAYIDQNGNLRLSGTVLENAF